MRKVEVKGDSRGINIYVGEVDQNGKYDILKLSQAEAALVFMKLKQKLNQ